MPSLKLSAPLSWAPKAAILLLALAGAAPAQAQNALGDGRILEKDLRVGGNGNVPRANFMNEVRARNAAVTGNAPNGESLHINSPYSAPDDFRGSLSSDSLFGFRRDSLNSASGYRGVSGAGTIRIKSPTEIPRLDTYGSASTLPRQGSSLKPAVPGLRVRPNPNIDAAGAVLPLGATRAPENADEDTGLRGVGSLRSTSAFTSTSGLNPAVVGFQIGAQGLDRVTASSLLGVRVASRPGARLTNRQVADQPPERRPGSVTNPDISAQGPNLSASSPAFRTSYEDLRDRLSAQQGDTPDKPDSTPKVLHAGEHDPRQDPQPSGTPNTAPKVKPPGVTDTGWEARVKALREKLEATPATKDRTGKSTKPATKDKAKTTPAPKSGPDAKAPTSAKPSALADADRETLEMIRKAGGETSTYTTGTTTTMFEGHLQAGQDELAEGRYFDAEERFSRALALRPGDATVMAARLNTQIGAGLYLSAASNLRDLFAQHPEVIGVRYTGKTMPRRERMESLLKEFRQSVQESQKNGTPVAPESALLLAYIGFQARDAAAVNEGLTAMKSTPGAQTDALLPALETVWSAKPATDSPKPVPSTPNK